MKIRSNASQVIRLLIKNIEGIQADQVSRVAADAVLPQMKERIHVEGKDSSGNQIGNYSNGYMKVRTGQFVTNQKFSKGKNKGATKPTGVYTNGIKKGQVRQSFNRTSDTKVVLSLTRQMENDMHVLAAGKSYGIGYLNSLNYQKSQWCEETYHKPIFKLTAEEKALAIKVATAEVENQLKGSS